MSDPKTKPIEPTDSPTTPTPSVSIQDPGNTSALQTNPLSEDMTFFRFMFCENDPFPVEAAKAIAHRNTDVTDMNPFFIQAGTGMGKTHLLQAMANATDRQNPIYLHMTNLDLAINQNQMTCNQRINIRKELTSAGILLIDDIHTCRDKPLLQEEIMMTMDSLISKKIPFVASSSSGLDDMCGLNPQLISHLSAGITVKLGESHAVDRLRILHMQPFCSTLPAEILEFLAEQIKCDVRRLIATGRQLAALDRFGRRRIDLGTAIEVMQANDACDPDKPNHPDNKNEIPKTLSTLDLTHAFEKADRFKKMFAGAETEEEQALALQIALSERLRQLQEGQANPQTIERLEHALSLLRDGDIQQALKCMGQCF